MGNATLYHPTAYDAVNSGGTYMLDRGKFHSPRFHQGVDNPTATGIPVYASGTGTVKHTGNTPTSG